MSGALRIFLYNWPIYGGTWAGAVFGIILGGTLSGPNGTLLVVASLVALVWSVTSLTVSYWIYDRSPLAGGTWLRGLLPSHDAKWISVDAGLDAEVDLDAVLTGPCLARLDVYDGRVVGRGSVRRARSTTPRRHAAETCSALALPVADASCDLACVVFTAHEVQLPADRVAFFAELFRVLSTRGRVLLVEHLRDAPNFLAFGPGFFHFHPRSEWVRVARAAGFGLARTSGITPWVSVFVLEKAA